MNQSNRPIELRPIKENPEDWDALEAKLKEHFKRTIYFPLLKEIGEPQRLISNSEESAVVAALRSGRITFYRGQFSGRFSASISKELKGMGAQFDRKTGTFRIGQSSLSREVRETISSSDARFSEKIAGIDKKLAQLLPEEIAGTFKCANLFDRTLYKTEKDFQSSVRNITIAPQLTKEQSARISSEWQSNMQLWIKDFTEKEIKQLRSDMQASVFRGNRYGGVVDAIVDSYGVSARKAEFLAHQETSLLMTKFKQTRYQEAGVNEYYWYHVIGSPKHPVRPIHKALGDAREKDGSKRVYRWDDPPIVDAEGHRKNPGQDYNCRCFAKPLVRFKK